MTSVLNEKRDETSIQAVMAEIAGLEATMMELLQSADKGIGAAGALIVAGLGFALTQTDAGLVVMIALPYGITAAFFFMLQKYIERQMRSGIKRWLEEALNLRLGQPVFQQTTVIRQLRRPDEAAAGLVYGVGAAVVMTASVYAMYIYEPPKAMEWLSNIWWLHIVGLVACVLVVGSAWIRMKSAELEAYQKARLSRLEQLSVIPRQPPRA
jgi:hypothetical protein